MWFANRVTRRRTPARSRLTVLSLEDRLVPSYTVLDLGAFTAYDLNNVGQVVGNMGVWQGGTIVGPVGRGINDAGQVAGGTTGAYLYDPSAGFTNLGHLPGDSQSYANDLNMAGQVVGVSDWGATGVYAGAASNGADNSHAFLWDATNGLQFLGPFPNRNYSTATCINVVGQVVGWAQSSFMNGAYQTGQVAFVRDNNGQTTLLGALSEALGINDLGQVVGSVGHDLTIPHGSFYVPDQAFLWQNGVATGLGAPAGYSRTEAVAINNAGQVVCMASPGFGATYSGHPFLWQNGVWTDLGFSYAKSVNINNNGQILVAVSGGDSYLMTPVDPNAPTISLTGFSSPTTAGTTSAFSVTVRYPDGTVDSRYTGTVYFTSTDAQAGLPGAYTFTSADAGVHTFNATLKTAGTQSITATDFVGGFIGHETGIVVTPAAASRLRISAPTSTSTGVTFSITVTALDAYGNVATGYVGTVHFSSSDNRSTLPANYTFTGADQGVHTFSGVILKKKGVQTITVSDTLLSSLTDSWSISVL